MMVDNLWKGQVQENLLQMYENCSPDYLHVTQISISNVCVKAVVEFKNFFFFLQEL